MWLKIISGVILFFNVIGYLLIWMQMDKNVSIKMKDSILNKIIGALSLLGGFIGVYLAARMFNMILKRFIALELLVILGFVIYYNVDFSQLNLQSIYR